jgi:hypothetical protein
MLRGSRWNNVYFHYLLAGNSSVILRKATAMCLKTDSLTGLG